MILTLYQMYDSQSYIINHTKKTYKNDWKKKDKPQGCKNEVWEMIFTVIMIH